MTILTIEEIRGMRLALKISIEEFWTMVGITRVHATNLENHVYLAKKTILIAATYVLQHICIERGIEFEKLLNATNSTHYISNEIAKITTTIIED